MQAIYVGYERRFLPTTVGIEIKNPPQHNLPNTGEFVDGFGNPNFVYAIGNPVDTPRRSPRYTQGQDKSSGFGVITFDQMERTISAKAYRFNIDITNPQPDDLFPGWPLTISQFDNYGREAVAYLPDIKVSGLDSPVIEVSDEKSGELEYIVRIKGASFKPKVFSQNSHTIRIGDPDANSWKTLEGLKPSDGESELEIQF